MTVPTVGAGEAAAAETTQSRGASVSEALAIFKAQVRDYRMRGPKSLRSKVARVAARLMLAAIVVLVLARHNGWMPSLPSVVVTGISVLLAVGAIGLLIQSPYWKYAELYREGYKSNRRFRIEQDALIITDSSGVVQSIPWHAIDNVVSHEGMLAIYYSTLNSACLLKAAHEGQDVEGFCAELTRRWQAHRAPTGAPA